MRLKLLLVLMLCSLSFSMTELQFSTDTATIGDEIILSGKFTNPGDTVDSKVFIDRDGDKLYTETTDLLIFDSKEEKEPFIDGAGFMDDTADGLLYMKFIAGGDGPFSIEGDYVWIFDDKGALTTLTITILPILNPTQYISGTVTSPDGPIKDLLVWANLEEMSREDSGLNHVSTITKADGTYLLVLPAEWKGKKIRVGTWDDFDVLVGKGYLPPPHVELLFDKDVLTQDFAFTKATSFIQLTVVDEMDKPIPMLELSIWMETETGGGGNNIHGETDANGVVLFPTKPGKWGVGVDNYDDNMPKFLTPHTKYEVLETTDTLKQTYKIHTTNGSVYVKVDNKTTVQISEHMIGFNLSVKAEGFDTELYSYFNYRGEMEFELAASTLLDNYQFHHWTNMGELDGYMISATPNSGLKVGDTVVVTIMEKTTNKMISGKVMDETGTPLANVSLSLHEEMDNSGGIQVTTDANGMFEAGVYPGKWWIHYNPMPGTTPYMVPEMMVEVFDNSDTVHVDYKVVTTDGNITVNLYNLSGLTIDEYDYGVGIYLDMGTDASGHMMKLKSIPVKVDDTTFNFAVSSMYPSYKLHSWLNHDKYPNTFITPRDMDSIKVGDVIRVEITKPNKVLMVTVVDDANAPVANADIIAWSFGEDHIEFKAKLDASGIGYIPIIPGEWEVFVMTETLMNKHHKIMVDTAADTTKFTYMLKTPNASISGTLVNLSKYQLSDFDGIGVGAEAHPPFDSMMSGEKPMDNYYSRVRVKSDGSFALPVLTTDGVTIDGYFVQMEDWNLPKDVAIAPSSRGFMFYPYNNVQPGNDSLHFALFNVDGMLYGSVELKILDSLMNEFDKTREEMMIGAVISVKEKTTGFVNTAEIMADGKYEMPLPKGDFEVTLNIYAPDTTITHSIPSLVMDGGDTEVRFTEDGIIITNVLVTQQQKSFSFYARTIDKTPVITFTVPDISDVQISLLDLRGRVLAEKSLDNLQSGEHSAAFANLHLASGFYISRIKVLNRQGFVKYIKFVIK